MDTKKQVARVGKPGKASRFAIALGTNIFARQDSVPVSWRGIVVHVPCLELESRYVLLHVHQVRFSFQAVCI